MSHSGPVAKGSFAWTLTLTDIATGWTDAGGPRGYDAGKKIKGRKRHIGKKASRSS